LDGNVLKHIITVLLAEVVPILSTTTLTPFWSCFSTAGVTNALDFVSMDAAAYGAILFPLIKDGTADQQLNVIQVKKLGSLFSWPSAQSSPTVPSRQ
jgi:hypothetical protein